MSEDIAGKMVKESIGMENTMKVIPVGSKPSEKLSYNVTDISDVVLTEVSQNKTTVAEGNTVSVESVLPNKKEQQTKESNSELIDRTHLTQKNIPSVNQTPSQMLVKLAAELQRSTSSTSHVASSVAEIQRSTSSTSHVASSVAEMQRPASSTSHVASSVAEVAHNTFLASQPGPHPILQQIQDMSQKFGNQDVVVVSDKESSAPVAPVDEELGRLAQDGVNETISTEVFSGYRHREILHGCKPHPGDIVEAGPLAAITPPDTYYPLEQSLPREIIQEGKLSSLQLEGVIQACQRHQMILPNGQRAGFFIGDAAGVGKGRQISGVILDNFARGRTKSIWFTISADLIVDTRRDLNDLGCYIKVIDGCQELDKHTRVLGLPGDFKEGVVFSTYATLVSTVQSRGAFSSGRQSRLQQLVDWCGGEKFDGCLVFDECHKAKNFVPGKEQASTKIALSVSSIQRMLPKARVLYCSATGVTDVKNMAFMERLGLWGEGAPYKSFEQFLVSVQKKGLGMAEMLAMEMKSAGMYVSRGLSYKQAEFLTIEASLTKEQVKMYDTAVHVWNELRKALESAIGRTTNNYTRLWAQFWSCHQRFFKQLCLGMKVPTIVKEAKEAINDGCCIVIGLQTTGEASLESELDKSSGSVTGFMSLCREMLTRFIDQYFPTRVDATKEGEIKEDPWSVTAKKMLQDFAKKIPLPDSPLDEIIDKLGGPGNVAEMTGRRGRIVRPSPTEAPKYETRTPDSDAYGAIDSLNVQERNMFMEGKKLVAIISDAASTGISLHADQRVGNQRRRVHLTVELPWSADKAVQQLGRSHRSNQSSGPLYKLLTTDLGGERRFAAAVARRLQSLGALTKGDRRAATGADLTEFNFDTPYGRTALRTMYNHICHKTMVPGLSLNVLTQGKYDIELFNRHMQVSLVLMGLVDIDMLRSGPVLKEKDTGDVSKFLNRILGLSVEKQNMIFTYFTECMKLGIQNAKKEGRYNEGMLDITASSVEMVGKPKEIFKEFNKGHTSTRLVELNIDRGMSWEQVVTRADNHSQKQDGFYISKRDVWGKKLFILATQKENSSHLFKIARPNTGLSYFEEEKTDLMQRYVRIDRADAEKGWKEQFEKTKTSCVHGSHCKNKDFCKVGSRCYSLHLLCGSIVTFMNILETTLSRNATKLNLSKSESTIRVVRVKLNDGERVVGIRYPQILIPEVETALKEQRFLERVQQVQPQMSQYLSSSQGANSGLAQALLLSQSMNGLPPGASGLFQGSPLSQQLNSSPSLLSGLVQSAQSSIGLTQILNSPSVNLGQSSSSGNVQNTSNSDTQKTVVQEVTPVNSKCLTKAMTPPITIKNFFKPSVKSKNLDRVASTSEKMESPNGTLGKQGSEKSCGKRKRTKEICYEDFLKSSESGEASDNSNSVDTEDKKEVDNKDIAKKDGITLVDTEDSNSSASSKSDSNDRISSYFNSNSSKKRGLDDRASAQPNKRPKQATLFSTLKKMATKKEEKETKLVTCPICSKVFEKGVSNADLNSHIDNCIIE